MNAAVVVTGIGTVGSYGCGIESLCQALRLGLPQTQAVERSPFHPRGARAERAALTSGLDLSRWLAPAAARRMSPPSKLAVAAARMALEQAGYSLNHGPEAAPARAAAVMVATTFGPASFSERLFRSIVDEGPEAASPALFTECVANAPAAQVAIACHASGPNVTIVQREAGGLIALARGAAELVAGRAPMALVGCSDELTPLAHGLLDRFRSLARAKDAAPELPRPFDRQRNGVLAAEGATVLVLEREDDARQRRATVLARLVASGGAFDPSASRVGFGRGERVLGRALARMLTRADIDAQSIDRIVSGASGAIAGDRLEAGALQQAWGDRPLPPVLVPKGITGEYGGGFLAAFVAALLPGAWATPAGCTETDPELEVSPHRGSTLPEAQRILGTSLAAGGAAAWIVLERP